MMRALKGEKEVAPILFSPEVTLTPEVVPFFDRRDTRWETTVSQERLHNVDVHDGVTEAEFVAMRHERDATLGMPKLIIPSLQVNMRAGQLPPKDEAGKTILKVPVNGL